jgi:tyrosinase
MMELAALRSRRQVLTTAVRGTIGGLGAALIDRGFSSELFEGALASVPRVGGATVNIVDYAFEPATISVPVGMTVTWTNTGDRRHTVTAADGVSFDSGNLRPSETFQHQFTTIGTFDYYCAIHPSMTGSVIVVDAPVTYPTATTYPAATTYPTATTGPPETYVRPNVHSLDPDGPELMAYAAAVDEMQALPNTNPLSWAYQANMHATWFTPPPPEPAPTTELPGWTTCEHGSLFFWPWHRMYLYWFERIIREMSGDSTFALPYWDYSDPSQRVLPAPFRDPGSPLFVAERDFDVNSGTAPGVNVPESIFDHCAGLAETVFDFASFSLEGTPHGAVHVWVAGAFGSPPTFGWMAAFDTAARDPVFWLHHSNIDRLWESWLALSNANSSDPTWLANDVNSGNGRSYEFFDEAGGQVTTIRVVNEVLNAATLGYEYEALSELSMCPQFRLTGPGGEEALAATPAATPGTPLELGRSDEAGNIEIGPVPTAVSVTLEEPNAALSASTTVLTLEGVRGEGIPAVVVEVYINLPPDQEPDFRSPYYVGNLNLFGLLEPAEDEAMAMQSMTQRFNIARNVTALEASGEWTGDVRVTFVPYYTASSTSGDAALGTPEAAQPPPGPWVTVESVSITAQ